MTPIQYTLLAILAFVAIALGSFVWFIANWDKSKTKPIGAVRASAVQITSLFSDPGYCGGRRWCAAGPTTNGHGSAPVPQAPPAGRTT